MLDAMFDGLKRKRRAAWNRNVAEVPPVVQEPLVWLETHGGYTTQGLFRVTGQIADIRKVKTLYDKGKPVDLARDARADPHNIGGVVKLFLQVCASSPAPLNPSKEMEDPLLTAELYLAWLEALDLQLSCLRRLANLLPPGNKAVFLRLLKFFKENEPQTKMGAINIAIVFAPSLLRPVGNDPYQMLSDGPKAQKVLEMCIKHEDMFSKKNVMVSEVEKAKLAQFERTLKMGTIKLARALVEEQKKMLEEEEDNATAGDAEWPPRRRGSQPAAANPKQLGAVFDGMAPPVAALKEVSPRVAQLDKPLPALPNPSPGKREPEKVKVEREERHRGEGERDRERRHKTRATAQATAQATRASPTRRQPPARASPTRQSPAREGTVTTAEKEAKEAHERREQRRARLREREKRRQEREQWLSKTASPSPDRTEPAKKVSEEKNEKDEAGEKEKKEDAPKPPERSPRSGKVQVLSKLLPPLPDTAENATAQPAALTRTGSVPAGVGGVPPMLAKRESSTGELLPALSISTPGSSSSVAVSNDERDLSEASEESASSEEEDAQPLPSAAESQSPALQRQRAVSMEVSARARGSVIRESARRAKATGGHQRRLSRVETVMEMLVAPRSASSTQEEVPQTPPPKALSDLVEGIMIEGIEDMSCMLENMSLDEVAQLEGALAAAAAKGPDAVHGDDEWEWSESDSSTGKDSR